MKRKTLENIRYVLEEEWLGYGKYLLLTGGIAGGIFWFANWQSGLPDGEMLYGFGDRYPQAQEQIITRRVLASSEARRNDFSLVIPAIDVEARVTLVKETYPAAFREPLQKGVAHYPSALPGERGTSLLLGHSAPFGWMGGKYSKIFSDLEKLKTGDEVLVQGDGVVHRYLVSQTVFVQAGEDIPAFMMSDQEKRILLMSCWPPGIDQKRIIVQADAVDAETAGL